MSQYEGLRIATRAKAPPAPANSGKGTRLAGHQQAKTAAAAKATGKPKAAWNPFQFTAQDVQKASAKAVEAERARMVAVFSAPATQGRERSAARLLANDSGWSAASIVKCLSESPADAELLRREQAKADAANARVWDSAIAAQAKGR